MSVVSHRTHEPEKVNNMYNRTSKKFEHEEMKKWLNLIRNNLGMFMNEDEGKCSGPRHSKYVFRDITCELMPLIGDSAPPGLLTSETRFVAMMCMKCKWIKTIHIEGMNCNAVSYPIELDKHVDSLSECWVYSNNHIIYDNHKQVHDWMYSLMCQFIYQRRADDTNVVRVYMNFPVVCSKCHRCMMYVDTQLDIYIDELDENEKDAFTERVYQKLSELREMQINGIRMIAITSNKNTYFKYNAPNDVEVGIVWKQIVYDMLMEMGLETHDDVDKWLKRNIDIVFRVKGKEDKKYCEYMA